MPTGSGAIRVHEQLQEHLTDYRVRPFNPRYEYFPPLLIRLRNRHADIVHATADHGVLLAGSSQPLVITFHNFVLDREARGFASPLQRLHYRTDLRWLTTRAVERASAITAVSHFTADLVKRFFELSRPVHVIPNGIDTRRFSAVRRRDGEKFRVLFSGNASRRKGVHMLRQIAMNVNPDVEIVCTFTERELLQHVGKLPNVHALGKFGAADMPGLYQSADALLMPTAREGFGLSVAEAMSCGLPVVTSNTSTMPELVVEGEGGYLCPLEQPEVFADRLNRLAMAPAEARKMGDFNRRRIEARYTMASMVNSYRALFQQLS